MFVCVCMCVRVMRVCLCLIYMFFCGYALIKTLDTSCRRAPPYQLSPVEERGPKLVGTVPPDDVKTSQRLHLHFHAPTCYVSIYNPYSKFIQAPHFSALVSSQLLLDYFHLVRGTALAVWIDILIQQIRGPPVSTIGLIFISFLHSSLLL